MTPHPIRIDSQCFVVFAAKLDDSSLLVETGDRAFFRVELSGTTRLESPFPILTGTVCVSLTATVPAIPFTAYRAPDQKIYAAASDGRLLRLGVEGTRVTVDDLGGSASLEPIQAMDGGMVGGALEMFALTTKGTILRASPAAGFELVWSPSAREPQRLFGSFDFLPRTLVWTGPGEAWVSNFSTALHHLHGGAVDDLDLMANGAPNPWTGTAVSLAPSGPIAAVLTTPKEQIQADLFFRHSAVEPLAAIDAAHRSVAEIVPSGPAGKTSRVQGLVTRVAPWGDGFLVVSWGSAGAYYDREHGLCSGWSPVPRDAYTLGEVIGPKDAFIAGQFQDDMSYAVPYWLHLERRR
jgi:hypothetical protein